ncbi:aKG-HExxH-type peptide beta-hydroxylase [Cryptosporangium aurantiacum]|uniref:HEXXH motif-containing protein n=1 Tax=Cryptosporangium aurantiacum TaxID=134849 RepID=A0A1M7R292_9ACTN|nr:HEXXH motif-containing putative peptide modification protein [Cryptosporangium aurantiacum]SHN38644.1 HEXXH motif-containing protein [Cryptosporangium aurantiacum]
MIQCHELAPEQLVEVSTGFCGASLLNELRAAQLSRHLLLIAYLADRAGSCEEALAVLDAARAADFAAASTVVLDPMVGAWLNSTVRRIDGSPEAIADQLSLLAAVAGARSGIDADLTINRAAHSTTVPTMGLLRGSGIEGPQRWSARGGQLTVSGTRVMNLPPEPGTPIDGWLPLRQLSAGADDQTALLTLDDVSPARNTFHVAAADRLSDDEFQRWRRLWIEAWHLLTTCADDKAQEVRTGLRTIVPLHDDGTVVARSATASGVFGALGATRPGSGAALALTVVHEFEHSKLNAVIAIEPLFAAEDPQRYFAPWRDDPRPIGGFFHGVFAFLAFAEVLDRLRVLPSHEAAAESQFALVRAQLRAAIGALVDAPSLTPAGRTLAIGLEQRLVRLEKASVSRRAAEAAMQALDGARVSWQERNGRTG